MLFFVAACVIGISGQNVKRVVVIKIDGLPNYYVDKFVKERDPETGRSVLPWFEEVFYKNGTRMPNFYTRGMSLSGPSWGQLDTGRHLQIKGNVEYDRYTLHAYDYLNFVPYYIDYGLNKKVDMPAVEVLDQLKIPIISDAFPYYSKYISSQLYQRGNNWGVLANGFIKLYPGDPNSFIDEWTIGLNFRGVTIDQAVRDITGMLVKRPEIDYYDYYDTAFDHVSHHNNDDASRLVALKELDRVIGKIWVAMQASSRAGETAIVLVSDHGFNSEEKVYSQGFNLVKLLASSAGGGHHVITKRRLMLDYSIKGIYPLVPLIKTTSHESYYLQGQSNEYPTALVDFDGNERSSIHLRNSDLNELHILLQKLKQNKLEAGVKTAATDALFQIIGRHANDWKETADEMGEELGALQRWIEAQEKIVSTLQMTPTKKSPIPRQVGEQNRRIAALLEIAIDAEADYRKYIATVRNLLSLRREVFDAKKIKIEDLIAPGAMGDPNTVYQLQNYVVGQSMRGLVLAQDGSLDMEKSFKRVNYYDLLADQSVRSNVQPKVSNKPIDFVASRIPADSISDALPADHRSTEDPIWLNGSAGKQALILSRDDGGVESFRYLPISGLREGPDGKVTFETREWDSGFPLKIFEDENFDVPVADRKSWLGEWHSEYDWLKAVHRTMYSTAIIGLNEQMDRHPVFNDQGDQLSQDEKLIRRFRERQRQLVEADMLILANNHWNFDVRGFNPGGNHGSFFRVSTNSTFMIAGGDKTGIPRGLEVAAPYDGLSFAPTIFALMGKIDADNNPTPEMYDRGFRKFPGRVVKEVFGNGDNGLAK